MTASDTKSALIDPFSFVVLSSRRDVPVERLYKVRRVAEKAGIKPGFGMNPLLSLWRENKRRAFFHIVFVAQLKGFATKAQRFKYSLARVIEEG
jgi:hypothetical protein